MIGQRALAGIGAMAVTLLGACSLVVDPVRFPPCQEGAASYCEGTLLVRCRGGFEVRVPCGSGGCEAGSCRDCASAKSYLDDDGRCYFLAAGGGVLSWAAAEQSCSGSGAHLVTVGSAGENDLLVDHFCLGRTACADLHIGLHNQTSDGHFVWITGEPLVYTNWEPGQPDGRNPDQHCVQYGRRQSLQWVDDECADLHLALCEREPAAAP